MATKYFMGDGGTNRWATDACWSTTSSAGPANTTHAIAGDDVILDAGSPSCTVAATAACLTLNMSGYTATYTQTAGLTVSGNVTLSAGAMTSAGTSVLIIGAAATLTANGHQWVPRLSVRTAGVVALADNWVLPSAAFDTATSSATLNGPGTLRCLGLSLGIALGGTCAITISGGNWSGGALHTNNITLDGDVTVVGAIQYSTGTITYSSGTITTSGSTLTFPGACTLVTAGVTWNNLTFSANVTYTINSLLTATGTVTLTNASAPTFAGSAGFTFGTLTSAVPLNSRNIVLTQGNTYTVTSALTIVGDATHIWTLKSSVTNTPVVFTVTPGCSIVYVNVLDLDSSGGAACITTGTVDAESVNWTHQDAATGSGFMWLS